MAASGLQLLECEIIGVLLRPVTDLLLFIQQMFN